MLITLMTFHPHKGGLWGPQALHALSPPNALFPRHAQGLTHRSRLHCSSQIPCTSLQITEQKLASAGKQGHSCKVPVAPPRGPGQVLGEPTLNSAPHVGVLNPDPSSRPSSLKSSLVLPASLPQTPQGEVPGRPLRPSAKEGSHFPSGSPSEAGCPQVSYKATTRHSGPGDRVQWVRERGDGSRNWCVFRVSQVLLTGSQVWEPPI